MRYELKLTAPAHYLPQAQAWLRLHSAGFVTEYPARTIHNFYFDTPNLSSFQENMIGISSRRKLRLRWYGDNAKQVENPVLELKWKENLLGGKKQVALDLDWDLAESWRGLMPALHRTLPANWQHRVPPSIQPTLYNRYHRHYYITPDKTIRATLDHNQVACDQRFTSHPSLSQRLPIENLLVIEIKGSRAHALRIEKIITQFPLQRTRNSKYANGILAAIFTQ